MENEPAIPAGWKLTYDEISNGVYVMRLAWDRGPIVETKGCDFDAMRTWCIESAKDIENQLRRKGMIS